MNQTKFDYLHIVVTVENWSTLTNEGIKRFTKQFARLRQTKIWKEEVYGGVFSIESTFNADLESWHPHLHVLAECKKHWRPDSWLESLKAEWKKISGSHVIHASRMYGKDKKGRKTRKINIRSVKEIAKYATKTAKFGSKPELVDEFLTAFENVRRMQAFGSFLGLAKEAEKVAESENQPEKHKPNGLVGCACGLCVWRDGHRERELIHISQTILNFDGTRQLRLFDSGTDPPCEAICERTESDNPTATRRVIPGTRALFDVAQLAF